MPDVANRQEQQQRVAAALATNLDEADGEGQTAEGSRFFLGAPVAYWVAGLHILWFVTSYISVTRALGVCKFIWVHLLANFDY